MATVSQLQHCLTTPSTALTVDGRGPKAGAQIVKPPDEVFEEVAGSTYTDLS